MKTVIATLLAFGTLGIFHPQATAADDTAGTPPASQAGWSLFPTADRLRDSALPDAMLAVAPAMDPADTTKQSDTSAQAATPTEQPAPHESFIQGSRVLLVSSSAAFCGNDGDVYQGHMGVGYYFLDGQALNIECALGGIDADASGGDTVTASVEFMLRSHWIRMENWSMFVEGGAGVIWSDERFPAGGTRWNFTPQAGLGMTWRLDDTTHLIGGVRWYHISNANMNGTDRNPGYNSLMVYAGLLFEF